jgi:hypothetical protein
MRSQLANTGSYRFLTMAFVSFVLLSPHPPAVWADSLPHVELSANAPGPRELENLTEQRVIRDYGHAWKSLGEAFASGSPASLDAYFVGTARAALATAVADQEKIGLREQYLGQDHRLELVFYAPEGDVMELHDTVQCQHQIIDGRKVIHDEQLVLHYVVLMTPGADRWVIRQLQAMPQF